MLDEGNLGSEHQDHFLKGKVKHNYRERGRLDDQPKCINQPTKGNYVDSTLAKENQNKKTCHYNGKLGHVEKTYH